MDALTIFFGIAILLLAVVFSIAISAGLSILLYKKAVEKSVGLSSNEKELPEILAKLSNQRLEDKKEFDKRLSIIEHKIDVLMMPEGVLKETELERLKVVKK
jgi:hypothetical protein